MELESWLSYTQDYAICLRCEPDELIPRHPVLFILDIIYFHPAIYV
jgi:hypothetical protein